LIHRVRDGALPANEQEMCVMRLEPLTEPSRRQAALGERMTASRGGLAGPFIPLLRSPELFERVEPLATYCSSGSALPGRLRELALLITARHFDAQHSWLAHRGKAESAGLDPAALRRLAEGEDPRFAREDERVLYRFVTEVFRDHFVADDTFAAALACLGERGLVDLAGSLGTFAMLGLLSNAFEVDLPPGQEAPFPDARK
jgi:4-carboxymuconolactone decarboxylase